MYLVGLCKLEEENTLEVVDTLAGIQAGVPQYTLADTPPDIQSGTLADIQAGVAGTPADIQSGLVGRLMGLVLEEYFGLC